MKKLELTQEVVDTVVSMYAQNSKVVEIARKVKTSNTRILELLTELGIKRTKAETMRRNKGIGQLDNTVFDILTADALYWIGFLYADGHIGKENDGHRVAVTLAAEDKGHLDKLNKFLGGNLNLMKQSSRKEYMKGQISNSQDSYRLSFSDRRIHSRLKELGFTHNKTLLLDPHPLLENSRDFWRGVIDGDGWLCRTGCKRNDPDIGLSGTEATLLSFIKFLNNNGILCTTQPHKRKDANVWKMDIHSQSTIKICDLLYKKADTYLDRKYQKYLSFIS